MLQVILRVFYLLKSCSKDLILWQRLKRILLWIRMYLPYDIMWVLMPDLLPWQDRCVIYWLECLLWHVAIILTN